MKAATSRRTKVRPQNGRISASKLQALAKEFTSKPGSKPWSAAEFLRELRMK